MALTRRDLEGRVNHVRDEALELDYKARVLQAKVDRLESENDFLKERIGSLERNVEMLFGRLPPPISDPYLAPTALVESPYVLGEEIPPIAGPSGTSELEGALVAIGENWGRFLGEELDRESDKENRGIGYPKDE